MCLYFTLKCVCVLQCVSRYWNLPFWMCYECNQFQILKYEKLSVVVHGPQTTQNLVISRCCRGRQRNLPRIILDGAAIVLIIKGWFPQATGSEESPERLESYQGVWWKLKIGFVLKRSDVFLFLPIPFTTPSLVIHWTNQSQDWFILLLLLLLPTPIIKFSLNRKRRSHKRMRCFASDSFSSLDRITLRRFWSRLCR